jgi:hypothetical protein
VPQAKQKRWRHLHFTSTTLLAPSFSFTAFPQNGVEGHLYARSKLHLHYIADVCTGTFVCNYCFNSQITSNVETGKRAHIQMEKTAYTRAEAKGDGERQKIPHTHKKKNTYHFTRGLSST